MPNDIADLRELLRHAEASGYDTWVKVTSHKLHVLLEEIERLRERLDVYQQANAELQRKNWVAAHVVAERDALKLQLEEYRGYRNSSMYWYGKYVELQSEADVLNAKLKKYETGFADGGVYAGTYQDWVDRCYRAEIELEKIKDYLLEVVKDK